MGRSFSLVDDKVEEANFFFKKLAASESLDEARFYFNAFVAAARAITFSVQSVMHDIDGFTAWYSKWQAALRNDTLAYFFHIVRTESQHVGINWVQGASSWRDSQATSHVVYHFRESMDTSVPDVDVVTASKRYFRTLLGLVFDCYVEFGPVIDPHQHYTEDNFFRMGKTIGDAEEEVIGVRGWTSGSGIVPENYRWQMLRDIMPGCAIDHLFYEYLGCGRPVPERIRSPKMTSIGWVNSPVDRRTVDDS